MNDKTFRVLDYYKIIELLKNEAASQMAKGLISDLTPSVLKHQVKDMQAETTEAVSVIMHKGALPLGSFYDTKDSVIKADKGGTLSMKQLLEVLYNLQIARNAVTYLKVDLPSLVIIPEMASLLVSHKKLEEHIDRCILSEDEVADAASAVLRDTRRKIQRQNESIRSKMSGILASSASKVMLQDALFTMRQGRYVIPVKQEYKKNFPGIIHDQSATGATLFIEPQAIVTLNNELRELELKERVEIERILAELSAEVGDAARDLLSNQEILIRLDFIFAKGKFSVRQKSVEPLMNDRGYINIRGGRHPLIDPKKVVPINISLGKSYDTLVITGPNTGGKTVTLKTVGLFLLMAQSGLHVPAIEGTELPVFKRLFADIGDEQSIEQSLSTFSSHMTNIVQIVRESDQNTLVLLDELGAGTDPTEGAALAIAILDHLYKRGTKTLATTHYTELKKYALATAGVENASVEFSIETLSPTYKLTVGIPGRSNAFEISKKLGLTEGIIDRARNLIGQDDLQFEDVLVNIEKDRKAAEAERDEATMLNLQMKKMKEEFDKQKAKLEAQKEKILSSAKEEARDLIKETKEFSDSVQKELRELEKIEDHSQRNRTQEDLRKRIKGAQEKHQVKLQKSINEVPVKAGELSIGDGVKVLTLDQNGSLMTLPDDRGEVMVQVGQLKINVHMDNIAKISGKEARKDSAKSRYGELYRSKSQTISTSVSVRGLALEEAYMEVDKYLDDAFMAGLKEVIIIHGRGEGILRSGLHQMFKKHKHIESYRKGNYNEGGDGVTIVYLK